MIDLHSHILPGLDDGVRTLDEARALARDSLADGITAIAATPHVRADYPTSADQMEAAVAALRVDFAAEGLPLAVLTGGEVDVSMVAERSADELRRLALGGSARYLLVEFPDVGWPLALDGALSVIRSCGMTPVLAHPERNREVQQRPERLVGPVSEGALVQLTAASLDGRAGRPARAAARRLLDLGFVHLVASDAHAPLVRGAGLAAAAAAVGDAAFARYLTVEVPAAIVAGETLPQVPGRGGLRRFTVRTSGILRRR